MLWLSSNNRKANKIPETITSTSIHYGDFTKGATEKGLKHNFVALEILHQSSESDHKILIYLKIEDSSSAVRNSKPASESASEINDGSILKIFLNILILTCEIH